jgi:hypothetical protein
MRAVKPRSRKPFKGNRKSAIELWKADVRLKAIREKLDVSEATSKRIFACATTNPENAVPV